MIKNIAAAATLLIASSAAFAAQPQTFYAGIDGGRTEVSNDDFKENSYGAFFGYNVTTGFAVEAGYRRLGEDERRGYKASADAFTLSGVGTLPVGERFNVFGRIGITELDTRVRTGGVKAFNGSGRAVIGVGVGYAFTEKVAGRLEFQKTGSDIRNLSAGVAYQF